VAEAWFGLIGVFIGGLVAFGATFLLESLRERSDAQAARRIVKAELNEAAKAAEDALNGPMPEWPPGWDRVGWTDSWSTYRPVLAKRMETEDFSRLSDAYLQMRLLQTGLAAGKRRLEGLDEAFLRQVQSVVSDARKVLDGDAENGRRA
jgi:hypothetical protein